MSKLVGYRCRYKNKEWLITEVHNNRITINYGDKVERVKLTDVTLLLDSKK